MSAPAPPDSRLSETVDTRTGVVRARGVLTRSGADLLCGTIETLYTQGHRRITLDLRGLTDSDADGAAHLETLILGIAEDDRIELIVRRPAEVRP